MWVHSLHPDLLNKGTATHSSILAWRISRTEEPGGLQSIGSQSWTWLKRLGSSSSIYLLTFFLSKADIANWSQQPLHLITKMNQNISQKNKAEEEVTTDLFELVFDI